MKQVQRRRMEEARAKKASKHLPPTKGPMKKKKKKLLKGEDATGDEGGRVEQPKPHASIPYSSEDMILLVGEGNFSFSAALSEKLGTAEQMVSTSYDTEEEVNAKYPDASDHLELITDLGGKVLHGVDARNMGATKSLRGKKFSKIIFNFPHAGAGIKDQDRNIISNQQLLASFFVLLWLDSLKPTGHTDASQSYFTDIQHSAKAFLSNPDDGVLMSPQGPLALPVGEVHVTLKTGLPYDEWGITALAASAGYSAKNCLLFRPECYPGYEHRRTIGFDATKAGNEEIKDKVCRTWVYSLPNSRDKKRNPAKKGKPQGKGKQKRPRPTSNSESE